MSRLGFSNMEYGTTRKTAKREIFFAEMDSLVPLTPSHKLDMLDLDNPAGLGFIKLFGKQQWRYISHR